MSEKTKQNKALNKSREKERNKQQSWKKWSEATRVYS